MRRRDKAAAHSHPREDPDRDRHEDGYQSQAATTYSADSYPPSQASTTYPADPYYTSQAATTYPANAAYQSQATTTSSTNSYYKSQATASSPADSYYPSQAANTYPANSYPLSQASITYPAALSYQSQSRAISSSPQPSYHNPSEPIDVSYSGPQGSGTRMVPMASTDYASTEAQYGYRGGYGAASARMHQDRQERPGGEAGGDWCCVRCLFIMSRPEQF